MEGEREGEGGHTLYRFESFQQTNPLLVRSGRGRELLLIYSYQNESVLKYKKNKENEGREVRKKRRRGEGEREEETYSFVGLVLFQNISLLKCGDLELSPSPHSLLTSMQSHLLQHNLTFKKGRKDISNER